MSERAAAEEDLRIIRTLMERATTYRAISAPSALVAGVLSTLAAGAVYYNNEVKLVLGRTVRPREFAITWMLVLLVAGLVNAFFVWREAKIGGRPFLSSGMRLALRAILPTLLIPAAFTLWFFETGYLGARELELVTIWVASYGLALLSTALFAPRSLAILGWAFLLSSITIPVLMPSIDSLTEDVPDTVMGITFGLFHLIYAVAAWPRRGAPASPPVTIE